MEGNQLAHFFSLVPKFQKFLESQGIDPQQYYEYLKNYFASAKRFFVVSNKIKNSQISQLDFNLPDLKKFSDRIFYTKSTTKLCDKLLYQCGKIFGMDLPSICAIEALGVQKGERFLDLCCAPGGKLLYICDQIYGEKQAEYLENGPLKEKMIFGNDISSQRLSIARNLLTKYGYESLVSFSNSDALNLQQSNFDGIRFDKILADVECTHDGSFKHILKYAKANQKAQNKSKKTGDLEAFPIAISKKEQKRRLKQKLSRKGKRWVTSK